MEDRAKRAYEGMTAYETGKYDGKVELLNEIMHTAINLVDEENPSMQKAVMKAIEKICDKYLGEDDNE